MATAHVAIGGQNLSKGTQKATAGGFSSTRSQAGSGLDRLSTIKMKAPSCFFKNPRYDAEKGGFITDEKDTENGFK
jgi:hypothetical protein